MNLTNIATTLKNRSLVFILVILDEKYDVIKIVN